jgi:hypothetical protein
MDFGHGRVSIRHRVRVSVDMSDEYERELSSFDVQEELDNFRRDGMLQAVLSQGRDLRQYSLEIESDLAAAERQCLTDCTNACL